MSSLGNSGSGQRTESDIPENGNGDDDNENNKNINR